MGNCHLAGPAIRPVSLSIRRRKAGGSDLQQTQQRGVCFLMQPSAAAPAFCCCCCGGQPLGYLPPHFPGCVPAASMLAACAALCRRRRCCCCFCCAIGPLLSVLPSPSMCGHPTAPMWTRREHVFELTVGFEHQFRCLHK